MSRAQAHRPTGVMASPDLQVTTADVTLSGAAAGLVRHTCNDGRGPHFGRKTPGCPRCDELLAGAPARTPAWVEALQRRQENDAQDRRWHAEHFAPGGPHATGACGPVCTYGDW
jgi:hypothetical protein